MSADDAVLRNERRGTCEEWKQLVRLHESKKIANYLNTQGGRENAAANICSADIPVFVGAVRNVCYYFFDDFITE